MKICVFGSGSFGTALAYRVAKGNHQVVIMARNAVNAAALNETRKNNKYLLNAKYTLPNNVSCSTDFVESLKDVHAIVHTIPVQSTTEYLSKIKDLIPHNVPIISASKGIHSESLEYMSQIIPKALGRDQPMAFFSGPSFAKELVEDQPTAVVVASIDAQVLAMAQSLFHHEFLRVYTSTDVVGVEVGGALKNVFAIAAGIIEGLGFGLNATAGMVTRGCSEMTRLSIALGANPHTLSGLSGIGDLMLTCYGSLSRNRTVGVRIGKGETLEQIIATSDEVAEGVATTPAAARLAEQLGVHCPLIQAVDAALRGDAPPREIVMDLLSRPVGEELAVELQQK